VDIAVAEEGRLEPRFLKRIPNNGSRLLRLLKTLGPFKEMHCAYEAGPTGYGLYRLLNEKGVRCEVVAPSETPSRSGRHVKTDRIDSCNLAHFLRSGTLVPLRVPSEDIEARRDLVRARADAKGIEKVAKQRLIKFLLRQGRRYRGKTNWTIMHLGLVFIFKG